MVAAASKETVGQQEFKMGKLSASLYASENDPVEEKILVNKRVEN